MNLKPVKRRTSVLLASVLLLAAAAAVSAEGDVKAPPSNAHTGRYGSGWECLRGFQRVGEACVAVKVPANAYLSASGSDWDCNRGYVKANQGCATVRVPVNAYQNDEAFGRGWQCNR